ncbi:MAG: hypothetical protein ACOX8J_07305 [Candidatus Merdisoma sp.]|jgi:multidrug efflux pump subunit AcrA (membrane-fusion protein)
MMELLRRQKNKIRAFGAFLAFMLLCTLISRSVYASGLPQVSTEKPAVSALAHTAEAEGIVEAGRETAVTALSGLRCGNVLVHTGGRVDPETPLFQADLEDLKAQIEEMQLAVSKLQLEIQAQEQNRQLEAEQKSEQKDRAEADYDAAEESSSRSVARAEQDLAAEEAALKEAEAAYETWKAEQAAEQEQQEGEEQAAEQEQQEGEEQAAEQEQNPSGKEDTGTAPSEDGGSGSMTEEAWQEQLDSLRQSVETAKRALEDARQSRDSALAEAERAVEDAGSGSTADNSLEINRLELASQQKQLKEYQELLNADGMVYPEKEGIITSIAVSPGERIPDGAAVVMADLDSPLQFSASLTAEQKKYVSQGDSVTLKLGSTTIEATADYIEESEMSPGTYQVTVFLDEGEGELGESGTLTTEARTDTYSCVVPLEAVYTDENQRKYVLVMDERSGILGSEFIARKVYVNVMDQNDSQAALEESGLSGEEEVIVDYTGEIEDGDVVRYKEE